MGRPVTPDNLYLLRFSAVEDQEDVNLYALFPEVSALKETLKLMSHSQEYWGMLTKDLQALGIDVSLDEEGGDMEVWLATYNLEFAYATRLFIRDYSFGWEVAWDIVEVPASARPERRPA